MTATKPQPPLQSDAAGEAFPMPPTDLPYDDGEPLESARHRIAMNLLIDSINHHWADRNDFYVGGNMFLYYSTEQVKNRDFRGPDFFLVLGVKNTPGRKYWAIWEEGGKYPNVIIELMSDSTAEIDRTEKKRIYEQTFKTSDYFIFDPYDSTSLQGWHLDQNQCYQDLTPDSRGWLWCQTLGLWLGFWEGVVTREPAIWLRFYTPNGQLVLLPGEQAQLQAEQAQLQAEQAQLQAEQAQLQAEQANQRAERLAAQLRQMGIDPDAV
ncbi:MAG: Uma2 family endonuclease [Thermosynechococcaceae cyanobacterium]